MLRLARLQRLCHWSFAKASTSGWASSEAIQPHHCRTGSDQYVTIDLATSDILQKFYTVHACKLLDVQKWRALHDTLCAELRAEGIDVESWQTVEDDSLEYASDEEVIDLGYIDPADGTFKRPWCAATRILEHRENEKIERLDSFLYFSVLA